jgi:hypothetical protein
MRRLGPCSACCLAFAGLLLSSAGAHAQSLSFGLRGGGQMPVGAFGQTAGTSNEAFNSAAKSGFGYGLDAAVGFGRMLAIYGGFDHVNFDCADSTCGSSGNYVLSGVSVGLRLAPVHFGMLSPWLKGGVTLDDLKGGYGGNGGQQLTTDRTPGYEIGAGLDIGLLGFLALAPQIRYVGQNLKYKIPGVQVAGTSPTQAANYVKFELGLSVHSPMGGGR